MFKLKLWFDVETRYKTTFRLRVNLRLQLWFDVETRYKTTRPRNDVVANCCGLM